MQTPVPKPEMQIRFADEAIVVLVPYPVEITRASWRPQGGERNGQSCDDRRSRRGTNAPAISLAPTGSPRLQADVTPAALYPSRCSIIDNDLTGHLFTVRSGPSWSADPP